VLISIFLIILFDPACSYFSATMAFSDYDSFDAMSLDIWDPTPYPVIGQSWLEPLDSGPVDAYLDDLLAEPYGNTDFSSFDIKPSSLCSILSPLSTTSPATVAATASPVSLRCSSLCTSDSDCESISLPQPSNSSFSRAASRRPRLSHNAVEKTYRDGINSALQHLQRVIPRFNASSDDTDAGVSPAHTPTKAAVLYAAINHIRGLEKELGCLREEAVTLRGTVQRNDRLLEKVALREAGRARSSRQRES